MWAASPPCASDEFHDFAQPLKWTTTRQSWPPSPTPMSVYSMDDFPHPSKPLKNSNATKMGVATFRAESHTVPAFQQTISWFLRQAHGCLATRLLPVPTDGRSSQTPRLESWLISEAGQQGSRAHCKARSAWMARAAAREAAIMLKNPHNPCPISSHEWKRTRPESCQLRKLI